MDTTAAEDRAALRNQLVTLEATLDEAVEEQQAPEYLASLCRQIDATRAALASDRN
jgi:hypothetical protein